MTSYTLHNYFRSSTSVRVRIALALKGIDYDYRPVNLLKGEQRSADYLKLNPSGLVPALITENGVSLTQSLAIIEYLDEVHPQPPLLPSGSDARARVRSLSQIIACDIHPVANLRILKYIKNEFGAKANQITQWFQHWAASGCEAFEAALADSEQYNYCVGDVPTMADICLYAQVLNNRRFDVPMQAYPKINSIFAHLQTLDAFAASEPAIQVDAI